MRERRRRDAQLLLDLSGHHPMRVRGEEPAQNLQPHLVTEGGEAAGVAACVVHDGSIMPEMSWDVKRGLWPRYALVAGPRPHRDPGPLDDAEGVGAAASQSHNGPLRQFMKTAARG